MLKKPTIEEMQNISKNRGGKCLSEKYVNSSTNLKWKCKEGHVWEATPDNIKRGTWCPFCVRVARLCIDEMQRIAEKKDGKCLSEVYINNNTKLLWQCKEGHKWKATPGNVKQGKWCPICGHRKASDKYRSTISKVKEIAASRGLECLSDTYLNVDTKLKWRCNKGHIWKTTPYLIKVGHSCPRCAGVEKLDIREMKKIAIDRGGACLSQRYINSKTKLKWQCKEGHVWYAKPAMIKSRTWCPTCATGLSERVCRNYFEILFGAKFPKARPSWLIGPKGYRLELDGYCKKLGIAFEYQGEQHSKPVKLFYRGKTSFKDRVESDEYKKKACKIRGVRLIEIPHHVNYAHMQDYIIKKCDEAEVTIPKIGTNIDFRQFNVYKQDKICEMQKLAELKGGRCLSKKYIDKKTKLFWLCKAGHQWSSAPDNIRQGCWCPYCAGKVVTLEELKIIAEAKGGKCLSEKYNGNKKKLKWECKEKHIWYAVPSSIKTGTWCPYCAHRAPLTLEKMQQLAEAKGGKCLSEKYFNIDTKLKWQCKEGHVWNTTPYSIKIGRWCPVCAHTRIGEKNRLYQMLRSRARIEKSE